MKVFITREICEPGLELLLKHGIQLNTWTEKRELTPRELVEKCKNVDALLSAGANKLDTEFLKQSAHLKVISLHSVGFDNVDISEANRLKIPVGHIAEILSEPTSDISFLLMLAVSRKAFSGFERILQGEWNFFEPTRYLGIDIKGKTLGIFGMGNIGIEMARKCKAAYNMEIIYCSRTQKENAEKELNATKVSFEELIRRSDVLSVHSTLNPETRGKFNKMVFDQMKPNSIFINTSRGAIHNEHDLIEVLQNKTIFGAGLDVTNPEPMDKNNPLLTMSNVAVLPHIGSATVETRNAMSVMAAENIIAAFEGKRIPYPVNPEVYGS
ncbi:MAG: D-glycerate dehydrogenase [Ginsengibacter sp.]